MTRERQSVSFRRLSWMAALLAAIAAAGAYVAYEKLLHYQRRAAAHLPPNVVFAARLDVEQVMLFDPVRRHLLPLVELLPPAPARPGHAEAVAQTRLARLRAAGLNLGLDLREIVLATTADAGWLIALGGLFPEQGAVRAIEQVLHQENVQGWQRVGDRLELSPSGAVIAQAADGTLLLASHPHTLVAALPASTRHLELGLPREGAGGAALDLKGQQPSATWTYPGPPDWLSLGRVVANVRLHRDLELELRIEAGDASRAQILALLARRWASETADPDDLPTGGSDPAGLWARTRTIDVDGNTFKLFSYWRASELDRSARELAAWLRRQLPPAERAGS